jgi:hypothetical protein
MLAATATAAVVAAAATRVYYCMYLWAWKSAICEQYFLLSLLQGPQPHCALFAAPFVRKNDDIERPEGKKFDRYLS